MLRMHLGRIGGAVLAACLLGGIANRDAISLMAAEVMQPDLTLHSGQILIDVERDGLNTVMRAQADDGRVGSFALRCAYDARLGKRICANRRAAGNALAATSLTLRSRSGVTQSAIDGTTTDTITIVSAIVNQWTDPRHHQRDINFRSTQRFAGVSSASRAQVLDGADTLFRSVRTADRHATHAEQVVRYNGITMPRRDADAYPTAGTLYTSSHDVSGKVEAPSHMYRNLIVYFDGTRTPDAYVSGKRYTLDLETGIATPYPID
jgi:hypothetical protein